jgi:hypothetical protein
MYDSYAMDAKVSPSFAKDRILINASKRNAIKPLVAAEKPSNHQHSISAPKIPGID